MARGILKWQMFEKILEGLRPHTQEIRAVVLYHGGEPLLNRDLGKMVRHLKSSEIAFVKTVSNGMLLTEELVDDLLSSGLDSIEFSLDGESPEENDLIRRNSSFRVVADRIHHLIAQKKRVGKTKPHVHISTAQFLQMHSAPTRDPEPPGYLVREFSRYNKNEIESFKCTYAMRWPHMNIDESTYEVFLTGEAQKNKCDHSDSTLTIRWNGDVVACCYDLTSQMVLGNVTESTIEEIWSGTEYNRLRSDLATGQFPSLCSNCNVVKPNAYLLLKDKSQQALSIEAA
jgi:radical SAM protein with 4Fe4S-binding SPASM domain